MKFIVGDKFIKDFTISKLLVDNFASVTGDFNPIHIDEKFAKTTVFKNKIAHGMLIASLISSIIGNDFPGNGAVYLSQTLNFITPVFIEDIISIHIEVIEIKRNIKLTLKTECFNQQMVKVLSGEAIVIAQSIKLKDS